MIRAAGLLAAAAAAMGAWSALLGTAVLWGCLVAAVAAAVVAWGRTATRAVGALLLLWPPMALLAGGVQPDMLWPRRWPQLLLSLSDGLQRLSSLGPGRAAGDPWPAAVWLLLVGLLWLSAAGLSVTAPRSRPRQALSLALVALPWVIAVALRQSDEVSWQGAAMVLAVPLWLAPPGGRAARPMVALGTAAALGAAALAHTLGPRGQWLAIDDLIDREPQFTTLDTTQTYGPLYGRRTGAAMLEISSPRPALWRMQVLERIGWRGWETGGLPDEDLPEPAARPVEIEVRVRGLRNDMVVSPGRIISLQADGRVDSGAGESWRITPAPDAGDVYRVRAAVVTADPATLRTVPWPNSDPRLEEYTRVRERRPGGMWMGGRQGEFGPYADPGFGGHGYLGYSLYDEVAVMARAVTAGARNQFEVVERVQRYLTEGGRFRYDTDVERTSRVPLVDFLLRTRTGYCQHFAGAAALLLRLAGVPARVVAGFATGLEQNGRYVVRDADAHAWIEVYFSGVGWVPFNPTPADADAVVDPSLDPFAPPAAGGGRQGPVLLPAVLLGLVPAVVLLVTVRRRGPGASGLRGGRADRLLERLAGHGGEPVTPGTTWGGLRVRLARLGPNIAAVAAELERARYAPGPRAPVRRLGLRIVRALIADLGPLRAARVLVAAVVRTGP